MHGSHRSWRGWEVMLHGNVFVQFLYEPGDRHRTGGFATRQVSSAGSGMALARRSLGAGRIGVRGMISAEPWTVSDCGYLNFLATGETCDGDTIHDRQHPHDLFMELAADYDRPLRGAVRWQLYAGLAGEPALGPGGFPHRLSAVPNPAAPITHHWLDATHISFGLLTTGLYSQRWKAEMSLFNGREPDARRYDVDLGRLDSVSGRLWLLPANGLAVQVSAARLREAEAEIAPLPRTDVTRATASLAYRRGIADAGEVAITLAYGVNAGQEILPEATVDLVSHAVLLEGSAARGNNTFFGRVEVVGKPAHDLHAHEYGDRIFTVGKFQLGYERRIASWKDWASGIGGSASVSVLPTELGPRYSGRAAPGFALFVSLRPAGDVMRAQSRLRHRDDAAATGR
jgi:hypothetical protein